MTVIQLTEEQSRMLANANDEIVFRDMVGNVISRVPAKLIHDEALIVAEARRRLASDSPTRPLSEVVAQLGQPRSGSTT